MKCILLIAITSLISSVYSAENTKFTLREEIKTRIEKRIASEGGMITLAPTGNIVRVVNAQTTVKTDFFNPLLEDVMKIGIAAPIEINDASQLERKNPFELVKSIRRLPRTGAAILFIDIYDHPTLLVAPENSWAIVNIWNLRADKPAKEVLANRIQKEFWRAFASVLGAMNTQMGSCVMQPVSNIRELDAIRATRLSAEPAMKVIRFMSHWGIERAERMTYEVACREGVAPAPTNDIQKAIWDKIHAPPKNPMKIEFDPKKGR